MNLNERNVLTTKTRGRGGYRGNWRRNCNKVKNIQMGATGAGAYLKNSARSNRGGNVTMSSSNINWKTPESNKNKTPNSSTLQTSTHSSNTKSDAVDDDTRVILALSEGRGDATYEVGLAAINITEPNIVLCQIPDLQSYVNTITKLNILNPMEILIPMTFINSNRLTDIIKSKFPKVKITAVSRTWYNNTCGFQNLTDLCGPHWKSTLLILKHKFYALTAVNALLNYFLMELNISYGKESLKVDFQVPDGCAIIDVATADNLELVTTRRAVYERYSSLMGVLNHCKTKMGARLLRATILQPPAQVEEIESRLDCVQELLDNPGLLGTVQESLSRLSSIHQLLSLSILTPSTASLATTSQASQQHVQSDSQPNASQRQLNYLLTLNGLLHQSIPLYDTLSNCRHEYLVTLRQLLELPVIDSLRNLIGTLLSTDTVKSSQGGSGVGRVGVEYCAFVIKPGVCALLDVLRTTYTDKIAAMREYVKSLSDKYSLPLTLNNTTKKGYHMIMQISKNQRMVFKKSSLPKEFIQVNRLLGSVTTKTAELINMSDRTEDMLTEIIKLSNIILSKTLIEIRKHSDIFYLICEYIAKVDMMQSLAEASNIGQTTRPRFGTYTRVVESSHPLLCYLRPQEPVHNDIHASSFYNLNVITGANGSGKSIYIRQVILLQVMAQIGCFVPARSAVFRVSDRILARVSLNDDLENNASAFVLEMREIDYFLTVLTDNTLIVIDELGRSTSLEAGTAIALAICKKLLSTKAFTFITTHYTLLPQIQKMYLNVKNWQMETLETNKLIDNKYKTFNFTYTLRPGVVSLKRYGLYFARICWPRKVIEDIEKAIEEDNAQWEDKLPEVESIHPLIRLKYDCESELQLLPVKTRENITERFLKYQEDVNSYLNVPDQKETSVNNNSTLDEENLYILQSELVYENTTNNSGTIQDQSIRFDLINPQQKVLHTSTSSKLIEDSDSLNISVNSPHCESKSIEGSSKFHRQLSDGTISSQIYQQDKEELENFERLHRSKNFSPRCEEVAKKSSSSSNCGLNKQNSTKSTFSTKSKSGIVTNSVMSDASKFPRQLSDGTISSQILRDDMDALKNLDRASRSESNTKSYFSKTRETTNNASSSNWGLNEKKSEAKMSKQIDCDDIDMDSLRSEIESYRDELLSVWDENEKDLSECTQITQNFERNDSQYLEDKGQEKREELTIRNEELDHFVSNPLQQFLLEKQLQHYENIKNLADNSQHSTQNKKTLPSDNVQQLDIFNPSEILQVFRHRQVAEEESISYSPRLSDQNAIGHGNSQNIETEGQIIECKEKAQNEPEICCQNVDKTLLNQDEGRELYSRQLQNDSQKFPNIIDAQNMSLCAQDTQVLYQNIENGCFNSNLLQENIFQYNALYDNYNDDFAVISNASQMTYGYTTQNQFVGFNFQGSNLKKNEAEDTLNPQSNTEQDILLSQSTAAASNVENLDLVSTRIDEATLLPKEVALRQNSENVHQVLKIQNENQQQKTESSNSDYCDFVDYLETNIQRSQMNNNLERPEDFHDVNSSIRDEIISASSKENTITKDLITESCDSELNLLQNDTSNYRSVVSTENPFQSPSSSSKEKLISDTSITSRNNFKSPLIPTVDSSSKSASNTFLTPSKKNVPGKRRLKCKPRFSAPLKRVSEKPIAGPPSAQMNSNKLTPKRKNICPNTSFNSPKRFTRKEIEEDFWEQDMRLMESDGQIDKSIFMKRPSVKQIQEMTCVVQFDENRQPIFNANAYSEISGDKRKRKQHKKFTAPLKFSGTKESNSIYTNFRNSLKQGSNNSGQNDGGYVFRINDRPNINLFASGNSNVTSVADYFENFMANVQDGYNKDNSADTDELLKKYL